MTATELTDGARAVADATPDLPTGQARLRSPFPASMIGKLPKAGISLDYVGHGAVTDRLLEVDPGWTWEPFAVDADGLPKMTVDADGNPIALWIRLTVLGVTRPGVGTCGPKQFDAEKVLIGDALRNAAMRFGVALDLWIRGEAEDHESVSASTSQQGPARSSKADQARAARAEVGARIKALDDDTRALVKDWIVSHEYSTVPEDWTDRQLNAIREKVGLLEAADTPPVSPVAPSDLPDGGTAPDPATGPTAAHTEPADADLVCCGPDCDELAVTVTLEGEAFCGEHAPA